MTRVALKGLAGRKLRTALTAIAIVLGVAMVSGSYILTDTIGKAFDEIFSSSYENTDAVISGKKVVEWSSSGNATVPAGLLEQVRALPEVGAASGSIGDLGGDSTTAKLIDTNGEPIEGGGPSFGFGIDPRYEQFNPLNLVEGRWASGPAEVVIDNETAGKEHFAVGDTVRVAASGPVQPFRIAGIARYGDLDSLGGATFAIFDVPTAQRLLDKDGFDAISVSAASGVPETKLIDAIEPLLPSTAQVRTGAEQAASDKEGVALFIDIIRYILLGFGGVALFVGSFVIFNTLSITVAQRTRELATLRTLGASRRQVRRSVLLESLVIGALASVVGLGLGFVLAKGLDALFEAVGLTLPQASTVFAIRTVVVSLLVGIGVTVLAGIAPALRATRVEPIAAVREGATPPRGRFGRVAPYVGAVAGVGGAALLLLGMLGSGLGVAGVILASLGGILLLFLGAALTAPRLVGPVVAVVGWPSARLGGTSGRLAQENAARNPGRTAATAAALMIGLALVTAVATIGRAAISSAENAGREQIGATHVLGAEDTWSVISTGAADAVAGAPEVDAISSVRYDAGEVQGRRVDVGGIEPATIDGLYRFDWAAGSSAAALASLGRDGAIIREDLADKEDIAVGDRFAMLTPAGKTVHLTVKGIYEPPRIDSLLGHVLISEERFDATFPRPRNLYTFLDVAPGADVAALDSRLAAFPDATLKTKEAFVKARNAEVGDILNLLYVLLALSVIVSLFGMVNTLVLSVFERTRELGMLRAVGMTRRQTRRMIRHESATTALIGASLGLPLGLAIAWIVTQGLEQFGFSFSIPVGSLVAFVIVAIAAGVLAAVLPARRAARLNVLNALQYE
jgi:putative ABC transport system permease protein